MNALTGTEEMIMDEEVITAKTETEQVKLSGLAATIETEINSLKIAQESLLILESGLTTRSAIKEAALDGREQLNATKKRLGLLYPVIMQTRNTLLDAVPAIKKHTEKERLLKQQEGIAKRLVELG